jgi:hypothetical protein
MRTLKKRTRLEVYILLFKARGIIGIMPSIS